MHLYKSTRITWMLAHSPNQESRSKTYRYRWDFENNNRKSCSSAIKEHVISSIASCKYVQILKLVQASCPIHGIKHESVDAVLLLDVENAFNSVNREVLILSVKNVVLLLDLFWIAIPVHSDYLLLLVVK